MKQTALVDLHLHLDGSLDLRWAYQRSKDLGVIAEDATYEDYYKIVYETKYKNREDGFQKFALMCDVLQSREDLFSATYDLVQRLNEQGLIYAEIRFASQQHTLGGLSQKEALEAVIAGAKRAMEELPEIHVGIIDALMHKGDSASVNHEENLLTVMNAKEFLGNGLVGIDLAGYENNCDFREYAPYFKKAEELGIPYTIHAGEMGIGEHVLQALEMHPQRIGHGIDCVQKEEILSEVIKTQIPLEICLTSNCRHKLPYMQHPIRELLKKGACVTVNTDNMTFSRTSLANEHDQLRLMGVPEEVLQQCTRNAILASFASEELKKELLDRAERIME